MQATLKCNTGSTCLPLSPRKIPSALRHNDLRRAMFRARLRAMSRRVHILRSAFNVIGGIFGVLSYLFRFAWLLLVRRPCSWRSSLRPRASSLSASMPSVE